MPWQTSTVLYPDAELLMTEKTRALFPGVFVSNAVPNPRRDQMLIWNRDGGSSANLRDRARMRCRVWARRPQDATDLARQLVARLPGLVNGDPIVHLEHLSGPYDLPDESGQAQRYLLFEIHTRGVPL